MADSQEDLQSRVDDVGYDEHLVAKVAHLYYIDGYRQRELAERCGLSTSTVSRYLSAARERGYVQIRVHDPYGQINDIELSLEKRFGLKECLVAPYSQNRTILIQNLAAVVGHYLSRALEPGELLGLGWGESMRAVGTHLSVEHPLRINLISTIGAMGEIASGVYPNAIAAAFARRLGARHYLVNTPALLGTEKAKRIVEADKSFRKIRELWSNMSSALVGASDIADDCSLVRRGIVTKEDVAELRSLGVTQTMNGAFFDDEGKLIPNPVAARFISMKPAELRRLRTNALLAYGPEKVGTILALLKGGHINVLLTDEETAASVLERAG